MAYSTNILLSSGTNEMEIVEFYIDEMLGGQVYRGCYGINVAKVVEIIRKPKPTFIPMAPPGLVGTFISRDRVVPLVDLAVQLGKQKPEIETNPLTIVAEFNKNTMAFVVAGVNRIISLQWQQIEPAGPLLGGITGSITGVVKMEDRNILLLDLEKVLAELNPECGITDSIEIPALPAEAQYKALIVDDSGPIRQILSKKLEQAGFGIRTASDGIEGLELLQEYKSLCEKQRRSLYDYVDIIISDIEMPQMDGYSLCHCVKQDPVLRNLPVILFSSLINEKQYHKGQSVGADDQIAKPEAVNLARRASELIENYRKKNK